MRAADIMRSKFRGFSLVEVLLVIMIIGILAGMSMLVFGSRSEKAEASVIMSDLDTLRNAMLAYSMEYRTRTSDGLRGWDLASAAAIQTSLDKYLDANFGRGESASRLSKLKVRYTNGIEVGFDGFQASKVLREELDRRVNDSRNAAAYSGAVSQGNYSLWLKVR
jgi:prepilin-type N-terminal cleavage/methylation domain-containing protein